MYSSHRVSDFDVNFSCTYISKCTKCTKMCVPGCMFKEYKAALLAEVEVLKLLTVFKADAFDGKNSLLFCSNNCCISRYEESYADLPCCVTM